MLRGILAAAVLAGGLALGACTPPESASHQETISLAGTVRGVDRDSRRVVIQGPQRTIQFRVSEEVRNFDQLEVGDRVQLQYVESMIVAMADPDDTGELLVDTFGARAAPGERPGVAATSIGTVVVEFLDYDRSTGIARVRTPSGEVRSEPVASGLRRFAETRQPGDRILVLMEQAVAVAVTPVD